MISTDHKRILWIDIAKGLGMVCIVLGHVIKGGLLRQFLYAFSVPFFFFLVGITYKLKDDIKKFYVDKFKRVVVPYLTFAIISILIFHVLGEFASSVSDDFATTDILPNILGAIYGNSRTGYMKWNIPLWFLTCLVACYILMDSYERFVIIRLKRESVTFFRVIFICTGILFSTVFSGDFVDVKLPFQFETAFLMSSFAQLGVLFKNSFMFDLANSEKISKCIYICVCIIMFELGLLMTLLNGGTNAQTQSFGKSICLYLASSVFISIGVIVLSFLISRSIKMTNIFSCIGTHTMGILLMHKFPVLLFQTIVPYSNTLLVKNSNTVLGILWGIVVTAIVIAMCLFVEKVISPVFPWIFGNGEKSVLFRKKACDKVEKT